MNDEKIGAMAVSDVQQYLLMCIHICLAQRASSDCFFRLCAPPTSAKQLARYPKSGSMLGETRSAGWTSRDGCQGRLSQDELKRDIKADFMSGFKNGLRFVRRGRGGW